MPLSTWKSLKFKSGAPNLRILCVHGATPDLGDCAFSRQLERLYIVNPSWINTIHLIGVLAINNTIRDLKLVNIKRTLGEERLKQDIDVFDLPRLESFTLDTLDNSAEFDQLFTRHLHSKTGAAFGASIQSNHWRSPSGYTKSHAMRSRRMLRNCWRPNPCLPPCPSEGVTAICRNIHILCWRLRDSVSVKRLSVVLKYNGSVLDLSTRTALRCCTVNGDFCSGATKNSIAAQSMLCNHLQFWTHMTDSRTRLKKEGIDIVVVQSKKALQQGEAICSGTNTVAKQLTSLIVDILATEAKVKWLSDGMTEQLQS
ncbi:hypothetical protein M407DRAFT_225283 [Tulasnella calospora MUT 4182]|uniref:Uncharacterized protein n=1 Tax=Tulasnella calospora MUT 4182 TaxID=1051891 RepID=A0A0C3PUJ2_9AGAM|nr:hypothetical protein M407DRAFT_225283 [Tulasnella calospora MUT 4182]